jgi:hypothetical protein
MQRPEVGDRLFSHRKTGLFDFGKNSLTIISLYLCTSSFSFAD